MSKKGLVFALSIYFSSKKSLTFMGANVDDYYSSMTSDNSGDNSSDKKKPVIKKKIIVRAKKVAVKKEDTVEQKPTESQEVISEKTPEKQEKQNKQESTKEATLNEAISKASPRKGGFTVVRRAEAEKKPEQTSSRGSENRGERKSFTQRGTDSKWWDNHAQIQEKSTWPKFKPGFNKNAPKPGQIFNDSSDGRNGWKKSKFSGGGKRGKYKNNFEVDDGFTRSGKMKHKKKEEKKVEDIEQNLTAKTGETVVISEFLSLKEFSEKIWVPLPKLIAEFMKNSMMMTINSQIDFDTAALIAESFEVKLEKDNSSWIGIDEIASGDIKDLLVEDDSSRLVSRAPVVSIMGHVDHWKTSLLDYVRKEQVAAGEAGGITQSIGAYQAEHNGKKITFLDTPGHEAFTIMRSRGAKSTDIAILVVAADEGVKPQTIESISHAKEAAIPVIVAINKMDKEGANPDHVKGQLAEHGLSPEDWGGEIPMVPVSAHTGFGIEDLLEIILLMSEMQELTANPDRNGVATVLESHLDTKLGPVSTVLVNTGTIEKWSSVVCGASYGKVKVLRDYTGKSVKFVKPGEPAFIVGLDDVVWGGDIMQVVNSVDIARQKSVEYLEYLSNQKQLKSSQLDILMSKIKSWTLKHLKIVLKADTNGSLEAIKNALVKLSTDETSVSVIHSWVGNITQWDVLMCGWSSAVLIWFAVSVWPNARWALEDSWVEYIESKIIYHITERIEKIVTWMLDPKEVEHTLCEAKVWGIFFTSKKFVIAGLQIFGDESVIEKNALVRVIRWGKVIGKWKIDNLKQWVEEVNKIEWQTECGIQLSWFTSVEMKDTLEVYKITIEK
jgi:translation initiation factor IF-2